MKAHRAGSTVGVFLVSASENWIDITKESTPRSVTNSFKKSKTSNSPDLGPTSVTTTTHWMAESGILDLFVLLGPSSQDIFQQYTDLTGKSPLPQLFALAYHQCRWNYLNEEDVLEVQRRFDEADIPVDVIWLDIEYAEEHKYFIWDKRNFPTPEKMQEKLADKGRKVSIGFPLAMNFLELIASRSNLARRYHRSSYQARFIALRLHRSARTRHPYKTT